VAPARGRVRREEAALRIELGDFEVIALRDAEGSFTTMREAFGIDSDEPWVLQFHAYLVRVYGTTIVVDTGVGPAGGEFLPDAQGWLPERLADNETSPDDVDLVVLTHLHVDHVGWNHLFERSRIVASRRDYEYFAEARAGAPYFEREVRALVESGRIELIEGTTIELADGVVAEAIPGHTPGHMGVSVHVGGEHLRLLGDLAVHEAQLANPGLRYAYEVDQAAAAQARRSVLKTAVASSAVVGLSHLSCGLGKVHVDDCGFSWEAFG
jgi:glyoxylase-like metal-dependent hydrolase (beta-lactamase superfamily II)